MLRKDKGARIEKQLIGALILLGAVAVSPGASASAESQPRSLSGSVKNGLIAYSFDGDIYVGDPATGETTAMVTNPEYEVNPIFAPRRQKDCVHTRQSTNREGEGRRGSNGWFPGAPHLS